MFLFVLFVSSVRWSARGEGVHDLSVMRGWCLGPAQGQSLVCRPCPDLAAHQQAPMEERPQPRGARPAEYRRPAARLGHSPVPYHPHNEHPHAGYRTAEPSDSPPRASRYALYGWPWPAPQLSDAPGCLKNYPHPPIGLPIANPRARATARRCRGRTGTRSAGRSDRSDAAAGDIGPVVAEKVPRHSNARVYSLSLRTLSSW